MVARGRRRADRRIPSLSDAFPAFADSDACVEFVARLRWPHGPTCPRCGDSESSYLSSRRLWKCKACKKQYSVKVGTLFEDSPLGLDTWLEGIWLIANSTRPVGSHELARRLGITQKSAWFLQQRVRLAMQTETFRQLAGSRRRRGRLTAPSEG